MKTMANGCKWVALNKFLLLSFITFPITFPGLGAQAQHSQDQLQQPAQWESELYADHALVGRIWDSANDQFVDPAQLATAILGASYLLLGEKHDNPDHHALQQSMLEYYIQRNAVTNIAFEMLDSNSQELLDNIQAESLTNLADLKDYLEWDEEGWDWSFYGPMLYAALNARIPISAANISAETMMQVYAEPELAEVEGVLAAHIMQQLNTDIDESHCGMLPASQFPAMVRVQQSRDNVMAQSLGQLVPETGKTNLLIAGNYHIRQDLGVPNYLLAQNASLTKDQIISVAFMEVDEQAMEPAEYLQQFGEVGAFDYIWFTPAISNEDYCASLRQDAQ
jgi:uncharacterized iron-regulated protein